MRLLNDAAMLALRELDAVIDLNDHRQDVEKMWRNNLKRSAGRTAELVLEHTQRGYGAEVALRDTGEFQHVADMVDDADTEISFADRMRDLTCDGMTLSVKTMKDSYRYFYVTETQYKSIRNTKGLCDLMVIVTAREAGQGKWRYRAKYLVDNEEACKYIVYPSRPTPWNSRIFMAERARDEGACVIIDDKEQ